MLPEKVIWSEGMLLRPQHFQQQDRFISRHIQWRSNMLFHYPWGLTEFQLDEQYIPLGKLVLSKISGILPDGTVFDCGHGQSILTLDIQPGLTNQLIYLTLPTAPEGAAETRQLDEAGMPTRFISHPAEVCDSNAGSNKTFLIQCGSLNLRLTLENELNNENYIYMPVARLIESKADRSLLLDRDFWPTFLHLPSSPVLSGYIREIIGLLGHRGDQLAMRVSSAGQTGTAEIADFLLLQCINRFEPIFWHLEQTVNLHPESFYLHLLSLIGELSTFVDTSKRPKDLTKYDHSRQHAVISEVMEQARYMLSMVLEQHSVELPMQERQYGIIVAPIHDRTLLASASFIVSAQADIDLETMRLSLPKQLKVGPVERIRQLVNLHLPGIKLRALPVAPRQIPFHAGKTYFKLDITSEESAQLEVSGGFAFYISGSFPGLKLQFWAIKE